MFENIEEPSGFWRKLWEERGTGNKNAVWLQEVKMAIHEKVTPLTGDKWALEVAEAEGTDSAQETQMERAWA